MKGRSPPEWFGGGLASNNNKNNNNSNNSIGRGGTLSNGSTTNTNSNNSSKHKRRKSRDYERDSSTSSSALDDRSSKRKSKKREVKANSESSQKNITNKQQLQKKSDATVKQQQQQRTNHHFLQRVFGGLQKLTTNTDNNNNNNENTDTNKEGGETSVSLWLSGGGVTSKRQIHSTPQTEQPKQQRSSLNNFSRRLQQQQQQPNDIPIQQQMIHSSNNNDNPQHNHHQQQQLYDQQQQPTKLYCNNNNNMSDDQLLTYSDDDHSHFHAPPPLLSYQHHQSLINNSSSAAMQSSPYEKRQNLEAYQIRQQEQMIHLARNTTTDNTYQHSVTGRSTNRYQPQPPPSYGSLLNNSSNINNSNDNSMYLSDSSSDFVLPAAPFSPPIHYPPPQIPILEKEQNHAENELDRAVYTTTTKDLAVGGENKEGGKKFTNASIPQAQESSTTTTTMNHRHYTSSSSEEDASIVLLPDATNRSPSPMTVNNMLVLAHPTSSTTGSSSDSGTNTSPNALVVQEPPKQRNKQSLRQALVPFPTLIITQPQPLQDASSNSSTSQQSPPTAITTYKSTSTQQPLHKKLTKKNQRKQRKRQLALERLERNVQAIICEGHLQEETKSLTNNMDESNDDIVVIQKFQNQREEIQSKRDYPFCILFIVQLLIILYLALKFGAFTVMTNEDDTDDSIIPSSLSPMDTDPFATTSSVSTTSTPGDAFENDPFQTPSSVTTNTPSFTLIRVYYQAALELSFIAALQATSLASLVVGVMMILNSALIQTMLCLTVLSFICFCVFGIALSSYNIIPVLGLIGALVSVGYCIVVWDRVPFATTNLNIALAGIKSSGVDLFIVAFSMMIVAFLWTILWVVAFLGVYDVCSTDDTTTNYNGSAFTWMGLTVYTLMGWSYLWTINVIMNIVHVTVAGVIGTWWTNPEGVVRSNYCCVCYGLKDQFFGKALTVSFGSICLGSLVLPPVRLIRMLCNICCHSSSSSTQALPPHHHHDSSSVAGGGGGGGGSPDGSTTPPVNRIIPPPIIPSSKISAFPYFDYIMNSCSNFGFTYVGIYRESFLRGSRKANAVFKERGWDGAVSDQLIPFIFTIATIMISVITGLFALIVEEFDGFELTNFQGHAGTTAFLIGCCIGLVLSSVCLKVVASSVSTVLVCFSVAPFAFKQNHPILSNDMRVAWGVSWLDELPLSDV